MVNMSATRHGISVLSYVVLLSLVTYIPVSKHGFNARRRNALYSASGSGTRITELTFGTKEYWNNVTIMQQNDPSHTTYLLSTDGYLEVSGSLNRLESGRQSCQFLKRRPNLQLLKYLVLHYTLNAVTHDAMFISMVDKFTLNFLLIMSGIELNPGPRDYNTTKERKIFRKSGVRYKTYLTNRSSFENAPENLQMLQPPVESMIRMQIAQNSDSNDEPYLVNDEPDLIVQSEFDSESSNELESTTMDKDERCQHTNIDLLTELSSGEETDAWSDNDNLLESDSEPEDLLSDTPSEIDLNNMPIYEGAQITIGESILMSMTMALVHNFTSKAFSDYLDSIRLHCKASNLLPSSIHELKKWYQNLKISPKKHYYCGECLVSLDENSVICPNSKCNKTLTNKSDKCFFVEVSLIDQLSKLYYEADFRKRLIKPEKTVSVDSYNDICDGEYYRQLMMNKDSASDHLTFTWNTDGVPLFKSSKTSMWPFFLGINELPFKIRRRPENLLLVGLWIGPKKPEMLTFMKPFIDDLQLLENGIKVTTDTGISAPLFGSLIAGTADLPAKCTVHNMMQYNGKFSCPKCEQSGESAPSGRGRAQIFPFKFEGPTEPRRTHDQTVNLAEVATQNGNPELGIKGPCWFAHCQSYDLIKSNCTDYMHCVLLGVMKRLISIWFSKDHSNANSSFSNKADDVNKRLVTLKPPSFIRRAPRSLTDLKYWKASEFRSFLLFYGPIVLSDILSNSYYSHFLLLSEAIYLLLKESITKDEVNHAENLLEHFVASFNTLYDKKFLTLNFHLLLHLPENVRQLGPIWAYSCFPYEDANGYLLKLVKGTQSVHTQLVDTISIIHGLPYLEKTLVTQGSEVDKLLKRMKSNDSKKMTQLGNEFYALGKMTKVNVDDLSQQCYSAIARFIEAPPTGSVFRFKRMKLRGQTYHSTEYTRVTVRNSYTVSFKDSDNDIQYGLISYFLLYQPHQDDNSGSCVLAVLSKLSVNNDITNQFPYDNITDRYLMAHFHKFDIPDLNYQTLAVSVDRIEALCISMESVHTNLLYICKPPNSVELE